MSAPRSCCIEDVLPSLLLLKETLWVIGNEESDLQANEDTLIGLARLADDIYFELKVVSDLQAKEWGAKTPTVAADTEA